MWTTTDFEKIFRNNSPIRSNHSPKSIKFVVQNPAKQIGMKIFLKYLGSILILVGVALLTFYHFGNVPSNSLLTIAGVIMVLGCIIHIFFNKRIE
jgi:uncharacterized membrane protein